MVLIITFYDYCRTGFKDTEPVDVVAEIQKGRDISEPKIDVREGSCGRSDHLSVCPLFLGSLMEFVYLYNCCKCWPTSCIIAQAPSAR